MRLFEKKSLLIEWLDRPERTENARPLSVSTSRLVRQIVHLENHIGRQPALPMKSRRVSSEKYSVHRKSSNRGLAFAVIENATGPCQRWPK